VAARISALSADRVDEDHALCPHGDRVKIVGVHGFVVAPRGEAEGGAM